MMSGRQSGVNAIARLEYMRNFSNLEFETRVERARAEMEEYRRYDYYLVNRDVDESVRLFAAIVAAERVRVSRLAGS
jgi:guanylate kinase